MRNRRIIVLAIAGTSLAACALPPLPSINNASGNAGGTASPTTVNVPKFGGAGGFQPGPFTSQANQQPCNEQAFTTGFQYGFTNAWNQYEMTDFPVQPPFYAKTPGQKAKLNLKNKLSGLLFIKQQQIENAGWKYATIIVPKMDEMPVEFCTNPSACAEAAKLNCVGNSFNTGEYAGQAQANISLHEMHIKVENAEQSMPTLQAFVDSLKTADR